ncbi:MAG: hypothetical protein HC884_07270 [Chloroflexaceae bacterium]|nr:hypothetical protein [Chloroflexaceae bacterium]
MLLAFVDRPPIAQEVERIRLILSTFQDGTGMLRGNGGSKTLPGWRDFERTTALALSGEAPETKAVFDVLLTSRTNPGVRYRISCKMRGELDRIDRDGRVTIEVSNSAQKFWECLSKKGFDQTNYKNHPRDVGIALIDLVEQWHQEVAATGSDIHKSFFLVLSWNRSGWYQLHQFRLGLPDPELLDWQFPLEQRRGVQTQARRLRGSDDAGVVFEWYGESGGQLKYYPPETGAVWKSARFQLEPLRDDREYGILAKAAAYFPERWNWATKHPENP